MGVKKLAVNLSVRIFWLIGILTGICLPLKAFSSEGQGVVPGEWIVQRSGSAVSWGLVSRKVSSQFELKHLFGPEDRYALFKGPQRVSFPKLRGISSVQPNFRYFALDSQDPEFEKSWGLNNTGQTVDTLSPGILGKDVGAVKAWDIHTGSHQVIVAVIDSGIDLQHEDLHLLLPHQSGHRSDWLHEENRLGVCGNVGDVFRNLSWHNQGDIPLIGSLVMNLVDVTRFNLHSRDPALTSTGSEIRLLIQMDLLTNLQLRLRAFDGRFDSHDLFVLGN